MWVFRLNGLFFVDYQLKKHGFGMRRGFFPCDEGGRGEVINPHFMGLSGVLKSTIFAPSKITTRQDSEIPSLNRQGDLGLSRAFVLCHVKRDGERRTSFKGQKQ